MTETAFKALQEAATVMAKRLEIWRKLYLYHTSVQDEDVTMPVADLWNANDSAALDKFHDALAIINGAQRLPFPE